MKWKSLLKRKNPEKILGIEIGDNELKVDMRQQKYSSQEREVKWKSLSHVWLFEIPWTTQSMEFSRPEYWSG